jgi:hypothetical protein
MLSAFLQPKEVEDEAAKDVKRLFDVGEAPYMLPLDPWGGGGGGGSSSISKTNTPNMMNGQERVTSLGAPHFC